MKIFVSWSGERSQALALALRDWLPLVLHYVDPWLSTADIKSGDRWSAEIAKELQDTNFGIICVTRDNLEAPWLLFESGALAKSMEDGRVIPLRLDLEVSDISGPLTQFQSEKADVEGIRRLVTSLNKVSASPIADDRLSRLFDPMWAELNEKIEAIPASGHTPKRSRPQAEILEELVGGIRSVEMRVRDMSDEEPVTRRRFRRRIHPGMLIDIIRRVGNNSADPISILIFASVFREDLPWFYELALDLYRSAREGDTDAIKEAYGRFRNAVNFIRHGPFLELFGVDSKMMHMMMMDAPEFMPSIDVLLQPVKRFPRKRNTSKPSDS